MAIHTFSHEANACMYRIHRGTRITRALVCIALVIASLPSVAAGQYWSKVRAAADVAGVSVVDDISVFCRDAAHAPEMVVRGCTVIVQPIGSKPYAYIYLAKGMSQPDFECALTHEISHVFGYDHDTRPVTKMQCGVQATTAASGTPKVTASAQ